MARKKSQKIETVSSSHIEKTKEKEFILNKLDFAWVGLAVVMLITLIVRWKFINIPFERDEGTYAYFGQLVLDGKIPYVDFYEMKFPGIYYCYAGLIAIFGATLKGIHIGMLIVNLATVYFVFRSASIWFNKTVGVVSALAFTFLSMNPHASGFTTQSEHLVSFFLCGGLLLMLRGLEKEDLKYYFFSGLLFSCSLLVKQNGVFFMLFGGLAITLHYLLNKSMDIKNTIISGAIYTVGAIVPIAVVSLIILSQGAWDEFVYWVYTYPQSYVGGIDWDPQGKSLFNMAYGNISANSIAFIYLALGGIVFTLLSKQSWHRKIMLLLFCLLSFLSISPGLRFYGHYWLYLMPAVAIAIGSFVYSFNLIIEKYAKGKYLKYVSVAIFIVGIMHHWVQQENDTRIKDYYTNPDETNILRAVYGQNPFPESKIIGDLIKENSAPEDKIAVFGSEPQMFIYSGRRGVSKHNYISYLVGKSAESAEFQKEYIADVEKEMPKFMVYYRHPVSWLTQPESDKSIFGWFDKFANENYNLVGLTQVLGPNQLFHKWGKQEALVALQDFRKQEQNMRTQLAELSKDPQTNKQAIASIQSQLKIFNFEIIVFERKES